MKKRRFLKGFMSFMFSFMLLAGGAILGVVFAAQSGSFNVGGSVNFTSTDIIATVTSVQPTGGTLSATPTQLKWTATGAAPTTTSWSGLSFTWTKGQNLIWKFTIKNDHTENALSVKITNPTTGTQKNASMSVACDKVSSGAAIAADSTFSLAAGATATVTITFSVSDWGKGASITGWSIPITLSNG